MKLKIVIPVVLLAAAVVFTGCSKQKAGADGAKAASLTLTPGVLTVGMEIGYPPMEYYLEDGKTLAGFDVQMLDAIAAKMGLQVKILDTAWDGIFAGLGSNRYDIVISGATITDERKQMMNFCHPYVANALSMCLLKGSTVKARSVDELNGERVAYQAETTSDITMQKVAARGIKFVPFAYDKILNCFDDLKAGRVDAVMADGAVAADYIKGPNALFEVVWVSDDVEYLGIGVKKDNDVLTEAINKVLDELYADGTMLKISMDVFGMDMVSGAWK
jgi:polar amino acid transport system substrate-binding protein